jgi:hypothetical protein
MGSNFSVAVTLLISSLLSASAFADDFMRLIPSTRWVTLGSPWHPSSYDECNALSDAFAMEIEDIRAQHSKCLRGEPSQAEEGGTCSNARCQALHTAMNAATKRSSSEVTICREKVNEYLTKKREEAARLKKLAQETEREQQEKARKDANEKAKRETDKLKVERERKDRDEKKEIEQRDRDTRAAAKQKEVAIREARERTERDKRDKERQASIAKPERNTAKIQRDSKPTGSSRKLNYEYEIALLHAEMNLEKHDRANQEQSTYLQLVEQLRDSKEKGDALAELAANPFEKSAEALSEHVPSILVDKALDIAAPIGREKHDPRYEALAEGVDQARGKMLESNPFAEKISGLAMEGVQKIHREVLGQLDEVGEQVEQLGRGDGAPPRSSTSTYLPVPTAGTNAGTTRLQSETGTSDINPFDSAQNASGQVAASSSTPRNTNLVLNRDTQRSYDDPDTGRKYTVPAGHSLYRDPVTAALSVVKETEVSRSEDDDKREGNSLKCSTVGKGLVLPECEKRRKMKNPFSKVSPEAR